MIRFMIFIYDKIYTNFYVRFMIDYICDDMFNNRFIIYLSIIDI